MGSLYTSIIPNLLSDGIIEVLDKCRAKIMYVCNMMTQPGETDDYTVSDHVNTINTYLGKKKIEVVIANNGDIPNNILKKYETEEQKDKVIFDEDMLQNLKVIRNNYVTINDEIIRHKVNKLSLDIYDYLLEEDE